MNGNNLELLYPAAIIEHRIASLARTLDARYKILEVPEILVVPVLKGSFIFAADLIRELKTPLRVEFASVSSYGLERQSSGEVTVGMSLPSVTGQHVLLIEDIIDTGLTVSSLVQLLLPQQPASLEICSLLARERTPPLKIEIPLHVGFWLKSEKFVVGYGLDDQLFRRNLPDIYTLV